MREKRRSNAVNRALAPDAVLAEHAQPPATLETLHALVTSHQVGGDVDAFLTFLDFRLDGRPSLAALRSSR
jgi:hypothetical protein